MTLLAQEYPDVRFACVDYAIKVDDDGRLQVRDAAVAWESEQTLLLERRSLRDGDQVVVSRIAGLVPGASVRSRQVDTATGRVIERASVAGRE